MCFLCFNMEPFSCFFLECFGVVTYMQERLNVCYID